jgi:radical SAM protein with 4Fe4S-binding SPASM domain
MTEEILVSSLAQMGMLGWNPRVEFAMHGEPTMHPHYIDMIAAARIAAPHWQLMMTSNAGGLLRSPGPVANINKLFEVGLNILALDDYQGVAYVPKIRQALTENTVNSFVYDYPADKRGNPHQRHKISEHKLVFLQDLTVATHGTHTKLSNHAGCGSKALDEPIQQRCAQPFRELAIRWDGNVALCCNDWRGVHKCGNVMTDGIDAIWNGTAMGAAREKLYASDRNFGICRGCDYKTYRNGLLPDKFGKDDMDIPDEQTMADIEAACAGDPYTKPVLNPWEVG